MKIIKCGFASRLTDVGRVGHQHKGYTQSGALDMNSHTLANTIIGQSEACPTIEVLLGGFEAKATENVFIAVTGAQSTIKVDGISHSLNRVIRLNKGQYLQIDSPLSGARNYIACSMEFKSPDFIGSVCAVKREKRGGTHLNGTYLNEGELLTYVKHPAKQKRPPMLDESPVLAASNATIIENDYILRITMGYQADKFDNAMKSRFFQQQFVVSNDINNMGMRLNGNAIGQLSMALYSEGIANGAIQITPDGLPIIMLAERQTVGGYPKIGSVISVDLPKLGQCLPGSKIQFEECDVLDARQLYLLSKVKMNNFKKQLRKG